MHTKQSIAPREIAVAFLGGATLVFTAWSYAGVMSWALHTMLVGGLLTLVCAVLPIPTFRHYGLKRFSLWVNGTDGEHGPDKSLKRLTASPFFWLGAAFLAFLFVQALNPSMIQLKDERGRWWIEAIEPPLGANWPSSIRANFEPMNAWRAIELHLAAGSLACGFWVGIRRRKVALAVLWAFLISGVVLAMVAMLQHFNGADKVLWTVASENKNFWGSFFYRNHASAYLNWVLVVAGCLYFYHVKRSAEAGQSGGAHFFCVFAFVLIICSVGLTLSRGGIIFASLLGVVFVIGLSLQYLQFALSVRRSLAITLLLAAIIGFGCTIAIRTIDWAAIQNRFDELQESLRNADTDTRVLCTRATWEMAQDRLWFGWGAGSFRYAFPNYQKAYPDLWHKHYHPKKGWVGRKFFRYAHNDLLQFIAEYGIIGFSLLLAAMLSLLARGLCGLSRDPLLVLFLLLGFSCAFAHAFVDFIFSCPAYWVAFVSGFSLINCFINLDSRRSKTKAII
jgi:hypothetical protein